MLIAEFLSSNPIAWIICASVFGLVVGSFLNVVIYRLPVMLERDWRAQCAALLNTSNDSPPAGKFNLATPRSKCPKCGHPIRAYENIPVLSYLLLRGRCSACSTKISPRYPIIELVTGILSAAVAWRFGYSTAGVGALLLTYVLITLTMIDFDHQLLPDNITLPFLWLGLLLSVFTIFTDMRSSIIGAVAGYLILWTVYQVFKWITGKEGMGYGDFKLLALLGAWMGWQALPAIILLSSLVGAAAGIGMIIFARRDRRIPIPFGPYLAAAGWIYLLWGAQLNAAYLRWSGM
ncbi:MAG: prepilin peptidase [Gammaproteobacteria bacterium]|nr:prepilin peptidase [Gammaproteobacteria bacterium]